MDRPPEAHASAGAAIRSGLFVAFMYLLMAIWAVIFFVPSACSRRITTWTMQTYVKIVFRVLEWMCGTRCELRGEIPRYPCIVAAKHQSFLDVMMLMLWLPEPRFVMKRSILYTPFLGVYAWRLGCIPIDRSKRGEAMRGMVAWIREHGQNAGQVIIFPQGTRTGPGERRPYKAGVARLYDEFDLPIVLMAVNTGWFWPRIGIRRSPGTAVLEVIGEIPPDRGPDGLMEEIETRIEEASGRLAREAAESFQGR